jgi:hypothetical protein
VEDQKNPSQKLQDSKFHHGHWNQKAKYNFEALAQFLLAMYGLTVRVLTRNMRTQEI